MNYDWDSTIRELTPYNVFDGEPPLDVVEALAKGVIGDHPDEATAPEAVGSIEQRLSALASELEARGKPIEAKAIRQVVQQQVSGNQKRAKKINKLPVSEEELAKWKFPVSRVCPICKVWITFPESRPDKKVKGVRVTSKKCPKCGKLVTVKMREGSNHEVVRVSRIKKVDESLKRSKLRKYGDQN